MFINFGVKYEIIFLEEMREEERELDIIDVKLDFVVCQFFLQYIKFIDGLSKMNGVGKVVDNSFDLEMGMLII